MVTLAPPPGAEADERAAANRLDEAVNDAGVIVAFKPVDGTGESIIVPAELQALGGNISYEVDTELPAAGRWQVAITVEGSEGGGDASFATDVLAARTINGWFLVGGVLFIVAFIGILGMRRRQQ
jgi:hypothetical protein